ncbi:hypothetical protein IFM89_012501, partial [Coptis chinensis]
MIFRLGYQPENEKLLESSIKDIEVNVVVAMDGIGTHRTISEALAFASLSNVMLVGDGKGITIITGSKSLGGGSTTTDLDRIF